ncbi:MAG: hypothetical protein HKN76_00670 [Saprospiraceae bacterium]|nr:hypothetical protein [Saprospiraceae bacterium]
MDSTALGLNNGTSWFNAFTKLQDALNNASACDTIFVAKGTYYPDEGIGMVNDDRGASFNISDSVVVLGGFPSGGGPRDRMANLTLLSGAIGPMADTSDNSYQVVRMEDVSALTQLDGFTISFGNANGTGRT